MRCIHFTLNSVIQTLSQPDIHVSLLPFSVYSSWPFFAAVLWDVTWGSAAIHPWYQWQGGGGAGRAITLPLFWLGWYFRAPDEKDNVICRFRPALKRSSPFKHDLNGKNLNLAHTESNETAFRKLIHHEIFCHKIKLSNSVQPVSFFSGLDLCSG